MWLPGVVIQRISNLYLQERRQLRRQDCAGMFNEAGGVRYEIVFFFCLLRRLPAIAIQGIQILH